MAAKTTLFLPCECLGRTNETQFLVFKAELRLTLVMTTMAQLTTRHELFAYGRDRSKKEAKDNCASMMMRQLFRFGIVLNSTFSTNKPGPNAYMWEIRPGPVGAPYTNNDIYVTNKLNELRPAPDELNYPSTILSHIEAALKCVSDWVHEEEIYQEYSHALNNKRTLLGMQRVGPIAMDMMLTNERRAHVVVTCGRRPTHKLLQLVAGKTIQMLLYTERGFTNYNKRMEELRNYHRKMDEIDEANRLKAEQEASIKKELEERIAKERQILEKRLQAEKQAAENPDGVKEEPEAMETGESEVPQPQEEQKQAEEAEKKPETETPAEAEVQDSEKPSDEMDTQSDTAADEEKTSEEPSDPPADEPKPASPKPDANKTLTFAEQRAKVLAEQEKKRAENTDASTWEKIEDASAKEHAEFTKKSWDDQEKRNEESKKPGQAQNHEMPKIKRPDPDYYQINIEPSNSGYLVTYGILAPAKMVVRVTLTSNVLRHDLKLKQQEKLDRKAELERIANQDDPSYHKLKFEKIEAKDPNLPAPSEGNPVIQESSEAVVEEVQEEAPGTIGNIEKTSEAKDNPEEEAKENENLQATTEPATSETPAQSAPAPSDPVPSGQPPNMPPPNQPPSHPDQPVATKSWNKLSLDNNSASQQISYAPALPNQKPKVETKKESRVKVEDIKGEVKYQWTGFIKMPTPEDHARFKFGPYFKNMSLEACEIIENEQGRLPAQPGLGALAELRRIKWYQHVGLNTPYLPDICRLIRGLAVREPSWRPFRILCPWTIALILEVLIRYEIKQNMNTAITLSPARVLRLCLESIAKGFRFPVLKEEDISTVSGGLVGGRVIKNKRYTHKLLDPCESGIESDALAHVSSSKKAEIRSCAKYALDLLNTDKICLLMNTEVIEELKLDEV